MDSAKEFETAMFAIPYGERGSEDRANYADRRKAIITQFSEYLAERFASDFTPEQQNAIYTRVEQEVSGSGFQCMEDYYDELADFARKFVTR